MSSLKEYLNVLEEETALTMEQEQLGNREEAFTHYVLSQIATKVSAENYVVCHASIKNSADNYLGEIFAYNESSNQEVLTLFYTIYSTDNKDVKVLTDSDVQYAWQRLQGFYDRAIRNAAEDMDESNPAYEVCKMIDDHKNDYKTIRFYILSNCVIKKSAPKKIRIRDKETDSNIWELNKLLGNLTNTSDHVEIDIDFENDDDYQYKIPYIQMESTDHNEYKCLLMMLPGKLLYKLYKKWNTDLLLYNVRYWLTFKKTKRKHTNADIRDTLRNNPQMFLAYNNGITAIASDVELEPMGDATQVGEMQAGVIKSNDMVSSGILKAIHNFQIVNGGQTTASIFRAKDSEPAAINLSGVFVQVKLIVIGAKQNVNELASKISRSSNSQNAVKDSDFSVSEQFNTKLQELSRSVKIPNDRGDIAYWYYERIRGQFDEEKSRIKRKDQLESFLTKYPKPNRFTKETLAIAHKSWDQQPSEAVKGAGTTYDTFISEIINSGEVPDENYFKTSVALLIIYNYLKARKENRNYKNGKAPVIAYSMAYLHYITFEDLPLLEIWEKQDLSDDLKEALDMIAELMFKLLSEIANDEYTSVLSISKRKGVFPEIIQKVSGDVLYSLRKLALG